MTSALVQCTFESNTAFYNGGACALCPTSALNFSECTFYANTGQNGGALYCEGANRFNRVIVAFCPQGAGIQTAVDQDIRCTDLFGNQGGNWIGPLAHELGADGNISSDPLFCGPPQGDLSISSNSGCNSPYCGIIGAWPVGCETPGSVEDELYVPSLAVVPNPMTASCRIAFENPFAGSISIRIADPAGRVVRAWEESHPAGPLRIVWDGRDDEGRLVPSSVYWARIETERGRESARIVLTR